MGVMDKLRSMRSHKRIILSINPTLAVMRYMKRMWRLTGSQPRILGKARFHWV